MILITDLDGTLARSAWRDNLKPDWDAYHLASMDDDPVLENIALVNSLHAANWETVCVTTRPEKWRQVTTEWLFKHDVRLNFIFMRADDDYGKSPETKLVLIDSLVKANPKSIILAIDDREDVVAAYRSVGISAMRVLPK